MGDCTIYAAKTKTLISCAVSAHLVCGFDFAYAKAYFFHDAAQISLFFQIIMSFKGHTHLHVYSVRNEVLSNVLS